MKKIILFLFLLFITISLNAQRVRKNVLYFALQPNDLGIGLRYDRQIISNLGLYTSLTALGNYKGKQIYQPSTKESFYIKNHYKAALGGIWYLDKKWELHKEYAYLSAGLLYHHYGEYSGVISNKKITLCPISFELGVGTRLEHMNVSVRFDPIKIESSIDIGFNF